MEKTREDVLAALDIEIREIKERLAGLERKVEELRRSGEEPEESAEHLELVHEDFLSGISDADASAEEPQEVAVAEEEAHDAVEEQPEMPLPEEAEAEDESEDPQSEDQEFSLFGTVSDSVSSRNPVKTLNEANASRVHKTVGDMTSGHPAWYTDIPGPEVKDIRSAISLNDRVMFISTLFREDSMLFQDVVGRINVLSSLDKAVAYLEETFPEWDADSELVYRFMMAVRRKIR